MTASEIRGVRAALGLTVAEFADLLGVAARVARRWEQREGGGGGEVRIYGMARRLVPWLAGRVRREGPEAARALGVRVLAAGADGGPLAALRVALESPAPVR